MKNHEETPPKTGGTEPAPPALQAAPQVVKRSTPMAMSIMLGIVGAVAVGWLIYNVAWLLLLLYLSIVLATILDAPVSYLQTQKFNRTIATLTIMGGIVLLTGLGIFLLINWLISQTQALLLNIQMASQKVVQQSQIIADKYPKFVGWIQSLNLGQQMTSLMPDAGVIWHNAVSGISLLTYSIVIFFLVMYLLIEGLNHLRAIFRILPKQTRREWADVWREMAVTHRRWFVANVANVGSASTLTTLGLWLLGIPGAPILGVVAGLGELVPNVGPAFGALPTVLLVLLTKPSMLIWVLVMFAIVQSIQGYTISPLMMKLGVRLPVLIILIAVLLMGSLLGFVGIVLAIPLTTDLLVLWNYLNRYLTRKNREAGQPPPRHA